MYLHLSAEGHVCPDLSSWPLQSLTPCSAGRGQLGVPAFAWDRPFKGERKVPMQWSMGEEKQGPRKGRWAFSPETRARTRVKS